MSTEPEWGPALAADALRLFPSQLRARILEHSDFRKRFGLRTDALLSLSPETQFLWSEFFQTVRLVLADSTTSITLRSRQGDRWLVSTEAPHGVVLTRDEETAVIPEAACVSPNSASRLDWFQQQLDVSSARDPRFVAWRELLARRALSDDEIEPLLSDLRSVPSHVSASLREALASGSIGPAVLVPSDIRHFEMLSPPPENGAGLRDYFATTVAAHVGGLIDGHAGEGLTWALLLGSHSGLADVVDVAKRRRDEIVAAFAWIASHGDRVSQVAAIECGLRLLPGWPELEPALAVMARAVAADDADEPGGRLQLATGLVALVEGHMANRGVARDRPPYWRRLVSIAHAGLLEREIVGAGLRIAEFAEWALNSGGALYYLQTLVDVRREPRWLPDFLAPQQLKAEWIGRVRSAAEKHRESVSSTELKETLWGENVASLRSQVASPNEWLPGPLEGGLEAVRDLPADLEAQIRAGLEAEELTPASFAGLANASLLLRVDSRLSGLAAEGLRRVGYQLRQIGANHDPYPLFYELAIAAATTRSAELADEVRVLVRAARRSGSKTLSPEACARLALIASAAHSEYSDWAQQVGLWFTELAFSEMTIQEAVNLQAELLLLLQIEPDLWGSCGRAEAALAAFIASMPVHAPS